LTVGKIGTGWIEGSISYLNHNGETGGLLVPKTSQVKKWGKLAKMNRGKRSE